MALEEEQAKLAELAVNVKSRILQGIAELIANPALRAQSTIYTKSDNTNYGMYQQADPSRVYEEMWQTVTGRAQTILGAGLASGVPQAKE
jgi:hypothetical protein